MGSAIMLHQLFAGIIQMTQKFIRPTWCTALAKKRISRSTLITQIYDPIQLSLVSIAASDIAVVWRTLRKSLPVTKL